MPDVSLRGFWDGTPQLDERSAIFYKQTMLAQAGIPANYRDWNRRWKAPFGSPLAKVVPLSARMWPGLANVVGPFAYQPNNDTRAFEYPWAFEALSPRPGLRVLEIGGGLSGFQFVLDHAGCKVVNVDPGEAARGRGWRVGPTLMGKLNRRFQAGIDLRNCFVDEANLADESFDAVVSISTIEHIPEADLVEVLKTIRRVLTPGGRFVATVDLFLDLAPFTKKQTNEWGSNVSIQWLVETSGLQLVEGKPEELFGFPEFDAERVRSRIPSYLVGNGHPAMVQAFVLEK